jgi:hypothetical protein
VSCNGDGGCARQVEGDTDADVVFSPQALIPLGGRLLAGETPILPLIIFSSLPARVYIYLDLIRFNQKKLFLLFSVALAPDAVSLAKQLYLTSQAHTFHQSCQAHTCQNS